MKLNLNFFKFLCLWICLLVAGCTSQPISYQVVESLPYKKGYMNGFYQFGLTEEVIKPNKRYKLTVKLTKKSSNERAKNMLLLHGAKLTIASGAERFSLHTFRQNPWCGYTSQEGKSPYVKNTGPSARAYLYILHANQLLKESNSKVYLAKDVIKQIENIVSQSEDKTNVTKSDKENKQICLKRLLHQ